MVNHEHYTYRVVWSEDDKEYLGLCTEFLSLSYLDNSHLAAMQGILDLVKSVVEDMQKNGETVPVPLSEKHYSGKFQVRIPPEQHRNLSMIASEQGISLNRYVSSKLLG
jgi:predicted HicB family RNase H-like nuclease